MLGGACSDSLVVPGWGADPHCSPYTHRIQPSFPILSRVDGKRIGLLSPGGCQHLPCLIPHIFSSENIWLCPGTATRARGAAGTGVVSPGAGGSPCSQWLSFQDTHTEFSPWYHSWLLLGFLDFFCLGCFEQKVLFVQLSPKIWRCQPKRTAGGYRRDCEELHSI